MNKDKDASPRSNKSQEKELSLDKLLDEKISKFVKRMKSGDGKDLYSTLIRDRKTPYKDHPGRDQGESGKGRQDTWHKQEYLKEEDKGT